MKRALSLMLVTVLAFTIIFGRYTVTAAEIDAAIFVNPISGNDENSGTEDAPLKTIAHAKSIATELSKSHSVTVWLSGGVYTLSESIVFDSSSSGQNGNTITFKAIPGENPIISGGETVEDWTLHDVEKNIYKASISATSAQARQFYIDGVSQTRAMTEDSPTDWTLVASEGYISPAVATPNANEYLILDLGSLKPVSMVALYPTENIDVDGKASGFPRDFTIETSTDGENFTVRRVESDFAPPATTEKVELSFPEVSARYIKLNVTKLGTCNRLDPNQYTLSLSEFQAGLASTPIENTYEIPTNLATASNMEIGYYDTRDGSWVPTSTPPTSHLVDGNTTSYATSDGLQRVWLPANGGPLEPQLRIEFGTVRDISSISYSVRLEGETPINEPTNFVVEVLNPNNQWVVVKTVENVDYSDTSTVEISFPVISASELRMRIADIGTSESNTTDVRFQLTEFSVMSASTQESALAHVQHVDFSQNIANNASLSLGYLDTRNDQWVARNDPPASYMLDGSTISYATSDGLIDAWLPENGGPLEPQLRITLGTSAVSVSAVRLDFRMEGSLPINQPTSFDINVKDPTGQWVTVKTVRDIDYGNDSFAIFTFPAIPATEIRIRVYDIGTSESTTTDKFLQFSEVAVYKPADLALNCPVIAPNTWEYELMSKDNLTNGTMGIMYTSNSSVDSTTINAPITIDLGETRQIGGVRLYPRGTGTYNYAADMDFLVSVDGDSFESVMSLENIPVPNASAQLFVFPEIVNARYVKIDPKRINAAETGSDIYYFQLLAIEVVPSGNACADNPVPDGIITQGNASLAGTTYRAVGISALHETANAEMRASCANDGFLYTTRENVGYLVPSSYNITSMNNLEDIEIHMIQWWMHDILKAGTLSDDGLVLHFDENMKMPWWGLNNDRPTWIENAYELIDQTGEWYIDRDAQIIYYKAEGTMDEKTAVLPITEQLLVFQDCENITFDGVSFMYTTWTIPNTYGYEDAQSGTYNIAGSDYEEVPGGIEISNAKNIVITNSNISNFGGCGIFIRNGSENCQITNSVIHDISSGGVRIGEIKEHGETCDADSTLKGNVVRNNYITRVGLDYYDSTGISVLYSEATVLDHNEIAYVPYSGISLGWGWDFVDTECAKNNIISNNYIHHIGQTQHDGGAIYTLGYQPSTKIYGNYVHTYNTGTMDKDAGLYLDEGSEAIEVYDNVVGDGVYQWMKMWTHTIRNNNWHNNYYSVNRENNNGTNNIVVNNTFVEDGNFSNVDAAQSIITNAGLTNTAIKASVDIGNAERHKRSLVMYPDSESYYFAKASGLLSFSIPNQLGATQYDMLNQQITILMPAGTNVAALTPSISLEQGFISDISSGVTQDFTNPVEYTFRNNSDVSRWTVTVLTNVEATGSIVGTASTLDAAINSPSEWTASPVVNADGSISFAAGTHSSYIGSRFSTDAILQFDMKSTLNASEKDWLGYSLRTQDPNRSLDVEYCICFNNDSIEVQKWVDGVRTMLYGTIDGYTPIFGNLPNTYFTSDTRHSIETGAINVADGVRLFLFVDGQKVFDIIDVTPIESNGFFSIYAMTNSVTLLPFTDINTAD